MSQLCSEDSMIDPSDYVETVQEAAFEKYEILSLMQYRNISMWISCMCQVWEQQLFSFVYHEALSEGIKYGVLHFQKKYLSGTTNRLIIWFVGQRLKSYELL